MRTVHKVPLIPGASRRVVVPEGARFVHVGAQDGEVRVWIELDTDGPPVSRLLCVYGTGEALDAGATYVGTCQVPPYVWHVYELPL